MNILKNLGIGFVIVLTLVGASGCSVRIGGGARDGGVWFSQNRGTTWASRALISQAGRKIKTIGTVNVTAIAPHPRDPDRIWIGTMQDGVYRSVDAGQHWVVRAAGGPVRALALDPVNKNVVYAVVGAGLGKTVDDGEHWTSLYVESGRGVFPTAVAIHPTLAGRIWLGLSDGRLLMSDTYGTTWELRQSLPSAITGILLHPVIPSELYVLTSKNGVVRTLDGGMEFTQLKEGVAKISGGAEISLGALGVHRGSVILTVVTRAGILTSDDRGETWKVLPLLTSGRQMSTITAFAMAPTDVNRLVYGTATTIVRSIDGGSQWTVVNSPTKWSPNALAFDPINPDKIIMGLGQLKSSSSNFSGF